LQYLPRLGYRRRMIGRRALWLSLALVPFAARAQSADARFATWLTGLRAEALRAGVDAGTLDQALGNIEQVPRVLELAAPSARIQDDFRRVHASRGVG
jgi:membrane-bound lytic murein transglycosylase B